MKKNYRVISLVLIIMILSSFTVFGGGAKESAATEEAGDIKIGFISAFTGVFSSFGKMQRQGAELALEEYDYKIAGKTIQVIYEDDQLDNELAVTKVRKLLQQDNIDILTGMVSGDEGLTVGDFMKGRGIPVISMYAASEDMTMREWYPFIFRSTWTGAQPMDPFGYWLAKEKGFKKIYMIGEDYSYPYNQIGGFKRGFYRGGGEEVTTVWHPTPQGEFSSIIAQIPLNEGYDAVLYNGAGADAVSFVKQFVQFGMLDKIPLIGQSNTFENPDLASMPKEITQALTYSAHMTADDLDTPAWNDFNTRYRNKWGEGPTASATFAYESMLLILRGIEILDGDVSDKMALVKAMEKVDLSDLPRSPVYLDEYHSGQGNVYIREVRKDADGKLYNAGIATVKAVSQFGPYDPDTYMSFPMDDRNYPANKRKDFPKELLNVAEDYVIVPFGK